MNIIEAVAALETYTDADTNLLMTNKKLWSEKAYVTLDASGFVLNFFTAYMETHASLEDLRNEKPKWCGVAFDRSEPWSPKSSDFGEVWRVVPFNKIQYTKHPDGKWKTMEIISCLNVNKNELK